jgi:RNA polymerase sigma-70 factor (ECF subfamily)
MPAASEELYRRHGPALVRKAERLLHSHDDAVDLVHSLFVEFLERGEPARDLPYLFRVVTNRCLNLLRDERNRARLLAQQDPTLRGPVRTRCDDQALGLDLLAKLVARVDDDAAEIVVYRFFDDLSLDEVAALCGQSRRSVARRLEQARVEIARLLEDPEPKGGSAGPEGAA